jgi:hypothetical protein
MSALSRQPEIPLLVTDWQADVTQLLDEHHLVAWSDMPSRRMQFAVSLGRFLGSLRDTEVCVFYGKFITDLDSFCYQLERSLPGPSIERRIDGPTGIASLLRARASFRGRPETKLRYYIWHDADALLRTNHRLFGQIVDAISGVAAEAEYASDDLLLIHRAVYVGGSILDVYADDERGQFRSWLRDGPTGQEIAPFWEIVTGVERPAFLRYRVDCLSPESAESARAV